MLQKTNKAQLIKDIIEWDTFNWGKFIDFIDAQELDFKDKQILELGARNGGLSLYFALKNANVICSDLKNPIQNAQKLHEKYGLVNHISYAAINATDISDEHSNSFDYITFKSVLGGIGRKGNYEAQKQMISSITKSLKHGSKIIFIENMQASVFHRIFRKKFRTWGNSWHYEKMEEIHELFHEFTLVDEKYVGFLGCFGKSEKSKRILGLIDSYLFDHILPSSWRYIVMYIYEKK